MPTTTEILCDLSLFRYDFFQLVLPMFCASYILLFEGTRWSIELFRFYARLHSAWAYNCPASPKNVRQRCNTVLKIQLKGKIAPTSISCRCRTVLFPSFFPRSLGRKTAACAVGKRIMLTLITDPRQYPKITRYLPLHRLFSATVKLVLRENNF